MKAAVFHARDDVGIEDIPRPVPGPGTIRVKVEACAVCGTDLRIYRKGDHRVAYPVVGGHEIAGIVDAAGKGVKEYREGERVCVAPGHGCGECRMCRNGYPNVCLDPFPSMGYKINGGFEEYMIVPEHIVRLGFVNRIPDELSFDQASLSEIVACCINGQSNAPPAPGETVLVLGSGPAGIIHTLLSKLNGAGKVIIAQRSRERLDLASSLFSVDRAVSIAAEDLTEVVMEETEGAGADVVFVCAPSGEAQETALQLAGPRGRVNFFGGLPKNESSITIDANIIHYKEIFLSGASSSHPADNRRALQLLAERKIDPDKLITHTFELDQIERAFELMEQKQCLKIVMHP